jgi:hypothetical protein
MSVEEIDDSNFLDILAMDCLRFFAIFEVNFSYFKILSRMYKSLVLDPSNARYLYSALLAAEYYFSR